MEYGVRITGVGMAVPGYKTRLGVYVPGKIVLNEELAKDLWERGQVFADAQKLTGKERDEFLKPFTTSDEKIRDLVGIEKRSFVENSIATAFMGYLAAKEAIEMSGANIKKIQSEKGIAILFATVSPDFPYSPPCATLVADMLGLNCVPENGVLPTLLGADIALACSSFGAALQIGSLYVKSGEVGAAIIIGSDTMSSTVDKNNRDFLSIVADAAGAVVLEPNSGHESSFFLHCMDGGMDGSKADRIIAEYGGSRFPCTAEAIAKGKNKLGMKGHPVFSEMIRLLPIITDSALLRAKKTWADIDNVFYHQANLRMIPLEESLREKGFKGKVFNNIQKYGNTTSASIPLLLAEAYEEGILRYWNTFMTVVFGGGYTWSTMIGKWTVNEPC